MKKFLGQLLLWFVAKIKKPPVGVSQPGELKIKVHLPINCSQGQQSDPDKVVKAEKAKQQRIRNINCQDASKVLEGAKNRLETFVFQTKLRR